ncbi:hypothetical protein PL9214500196 [Planktothrix tepida PCC 9214]|uniref:Uncharacterized protein n=1 Tax=Planktothrix tepida PCC 9214 TaxID=671072 RepID=A0A1J1LK42_9CYAN|nr:hypothetical protein PL9214500196 [Planktothrix tepida PCC 9214]
MKQYLTLKAISFGSVIIAINPFQGLKPGNTALIFILIIGYNSH